MKSNLMDENMFCRDRYSLIIVLIAVDEISIFIDFENTCLIGNGMSYFFIHEWIDTFYSRILSN